MRACSCASISRYRGRVVGSPRIPLANDGPAHPVKDDTPAAADLLHAPDRGYRQPQRFDRRVVPRFAEDGLLGACRPIELDDAGTPLEHLGDIAGREQSADAFTHRPAPTPYPLLRSPAARPLIVRWIPVTTFSSASPAR